MNDEVRDGIVAAGVAAVVSGAPSTAHALYRGESVLTATRAAGTLLGRPSVTRGLGAHVALSLMWGAVLMRVLPQRNRVLAGAFAGAAIAALDLGVIGRRVPAVRALPQLPQWADHVVFGAAFGAALDAAERRRAVNCPSQYPDRPVDRPERTGVDGHPSSGDLG